MNLNISLSLDQLNLVMAALSKLPFEAVNETIAVIKQQGTDQLKAFEAGKASEEQVVQ